MNENIAYIPTYIKFRDWHYVAPKIKYQLKVNLYELDIEIRTHLTGTHKVNIKNYELDEDIACQIKKVLELSVVNTFLDIPENKRCEGGYRDGWHTEYELNYPNIPIIKGELGTIFKESPFEKTLDILRKAYPFISELSKF